MSDASHKSVPEWARQKACDLLNKECREGGSSYSANWRPLVYGYHPTIDAFARYIAEHEAPPVDLFQSAVEEALDWWDNHTSQSDPVGEVVKILRRKGIELAGESK